MSNNLLLDKPTVKIGKMEFSNQEFLRELGLNPVPFDRFGIKDKKDFFNVVGEAAGKILLIREQFLLEAQRKLKIDSGKYTFQPDQSFDVASTHNLYVQMMNDLTTSEAIIRQLFPLRKSGGNFGFVIAVDRDWEFSKQYQCQSLHIKITDDEIEVVGLT